MNNHINYKIIYKTENLLTKEQKQDINAKLLETVNQIVEYHKNKIGNYFSINIDIDFYLDV